MNIERAIEEKASRSAVTFAEASKRAGVNRTEIGAGVTPRGRRAPAVRAVGRPCANEVMCEAPVMGLGRPFCLRLIAEQIGAPVAQLELTQLWDWFVIRPLTDGPPADLEEPGQLGVGLKSEAGLRLGFCDVHW